MHATHGLPTNPDARLGGKTKTHGAKLLYPLNRAHGQPLAGFADELDGRARHAPRPVTGTGDTRPDGQS